MLPRHRHPSQARPNAEVLAKLSPEGDQAWPLLLHRGFLPISQLSRLFLYIHHAGLEALWASPCPRRCHEPERDYPLFVQHPA